MNDRTSFIGAWVSKEEKQEIVKIAKAQNTSVSGLIRQCIIRPTMTLPDVAKSVKIHIDNKFKNLENELKRQLFAREPIRRMIIEEYPPYERLQPPKEVIELTPRQKQKLKVIEEMKKIISGEKEYTFVKVQEEEIGKRPKTDNLAYIEFKEKVIKRKPLYQQI
jgi:hypothetical protein